MVIGCYKKLFKKSFDNFYLKNMVYFYEFDAENVKNLEKLTFLAIYLEFCHFFTVGHTKDPKILCLISVRILRLDLGLSSSTSVRLIRSKFLWFFENCNFFEFTKVPILRFYALEKTKAKKSAGKWLH